MDVLSENKAETLATEENVQVATQNTSVTQTKIGQATSEATTAPSVASTPVTSTANTVSLNSGQPIKLVTQSGQAVSITHLNKGLLKSADGGSIIFRTLPKQINVSQIAGKTLTTVGNVPKKIIPIGATSGASAPKKLILTANNLNNNQIKTSGPIINTNMTQLIKIVPAVSTTASTSATNNMIQVIPSGKTITLAQAQEMGLLTHAKIQTITSAGAMTSSGTITTTAGTKQVFINRTIPKGAQIVKLGNQLIRTSPLKRPTKILPATPKLIAAKTQTVLQPNQKLIAIKQTGTSKVLTSTAITPAVTVASLTTAPKTIQVQGLTATTSQGQQLVRISANQLGIPLGTNLMNSQLSRINYPSGQNIQYLRVVSAPSGATNSNTITVMSKSSANAATTSTGAKLPTMLPVAFINNKNAAGLSQGSINLVKVFPMSQANAVNNGRSITISTSKLNQKLHLLPTISSAQVKTITAGSLITTTSSDNKKSLFISSDKKPQQMIQIPSKPTSKVDEVKKETIDVKVEKQTSTCANGTTSKVTEQTLKIERDADAGPTIGTNNYHDYGRYPFSNSSGGGSGPSSTGSGGGRTSPPRRSGTLDTHRRPVLRPRKPCNCTKSQCLKLYCDCFANGEFCYMCNCLSCFNNLENEEERTKAIRNCLERNPQAFKPKIGKDRHLGDETIRKHTKGCNCKRSGCLKNYCECYEAKIACSSNCRCFGCRNIEDGGVDAQGLRPPANPMISLMDRRLHELRLSTPTNHLSISMKDETCAVDDKMSASLVKRRLDLNAALGYNSRGERPSRFPISFMTREVVEATCECLIARAHETEINNLSEENAEQRVLEEFGKCLTEVIRSATGGKNDNRRFFAT